MFTEGNSMRTLIQAGLFSLFTSCGRWSRVDYVWQENLASHLVILNSNSLFQQHFRQCWNAYRFQYLPIFFTLILYLRDTSVEHKQQCVRRYQRMIALLLEFVSRMFLNAKKNPHSNHSASKNPIGRSVTQFFRENTLLALIRFTKSTFWINLFLQCVFAYSDLLKAINVSREI